ncbi:hypothetical protein [Acinetobacter phage ABPH49]|nr:hypothetical protein [Acinetobacter phage ABPH49]
MNLPTAEEMAKRTTEALQKEVILPEAVWEHIRNVPATQTQTKLTRKIVGASLNHEMLTAGQLLKSLGYEVTYSCDDYHLTEIVSIRISWKHLVKGEGR